VINNALGIEEAMNIGSNTEQTHPQDKVNADTNDAGEDG
jgi:hypothetical protein